LVGTVLCIETSTTNNGATIADFSQYPGEEETVWNACSHVQRRPGMDEVVVTEEGKIVKIINVLVSANSKAESVEELEGRRKRVVESVLDTLHADVSGIVDALAASPEFKARVSQDPRPDLKDRFIESIRREITAQIAVYKGMPDSAFSSIGVFGDAVVDALGLELLVLSKYHVWLADQWSPSGFRWEKASGNEPASGLKWLRLDDSDQPPGSQILANAELEEALTRRTEFSQQEWAVFGVRDLRLHHVVKVTEKSGQGGEEGKSGDRYYKPAEPVFGRMLTNLELADALSRKTEFSAQELAAYGIQDVGMHDYILSKGSHFRPAALDLSAMGDNSSSNNFFVGLQAAQLLRQEQRRRLLQPPTVAHDGVGRIVIQDGSARMGGGAKVTAALAREVCVCACAWECLCLCEDNDSVARVAMCVTRTILCACACACACAYVCACACA
jgi:hypothetical protein